MRLIRLGIVGLALLAASACSQQATDEELRDMVREEVMAAIAEVKQGPPGEQGPPPSEEALSQLIQEVVIDLREELRGPQGPQGTQGPQGIQGRQGEPGTAELSGRDRAALSRVDSLSRDLDTL